MWRIYRFTQVFPRLISPSTTWDEGAKSRHAPPRVVVLVAACGTASLLRSVLRSAFGRCVALTGQFFRQATGMGTLRRLARAAGFVLPDVSHPIRNIGGGAATAPAGVNGGVWNTFGHWYRVTEGRISKASGVVFFLGVTPQGVRS